MKLKFTLLIIFCLGFFIGCKTAKYKSQEPCMVIRFQMRENINKYIKSGRMAENPLILKNGKIYKRFLEVDSLELDTTYLENVQSLTVQKDSDFFINCLGEIAKDGVFTISTEKLHNSEIESEIIYLINGEISDSKEFARAQKRNKTRLNYFIPNLKIKNSYINVIDISILKN